jgi:hypothetical protein
LYEIILDPFQRHQIILNAIEKRRAHLADCLSYNPIPDPLEGKGHMGRVILRLKQGIADLEEEDRKLLLQAAQRHLFLNPAKDNRNPLTANHLARDRWLISTASPAVNQSTSVGRRQRRPPDVRKELIALLKARNPNMKARRICELIDQRIEKSVPIRRDNLSPLKSWQMQASGKRSWVELYDHPKTHNRVRAYVNKVPTLQTATKSSR